MPITGGLLALSRHHVALHAAVRAANWCRTNPVKAIGLHERPIQRSAIRTFAYLGCYAVHVPNGSHLAGGALARAKQMAALKADGLSPGFPDLIVIDQRARRRVGLVECKREGLDELDPDQVVWRDECVRIGVPWALLNTIAGPIEILRMWGWR